MGIGELSLGLQKNENPFGSGLCITGSCYIRSAFNGLGILSESSEMGLDVMSAQHKSAYSTVVAAVAQVPVQNVLVGSNYGNRATMAIAANAQSLN